MDAVREISGALKNLRRRPAFAILACLTLALSVGANVVVFSVINGLALKPRPISQPDRVVMVTSMNDSGGDDEGHAFYQRGMERVAQAGAFDTVAGQVPTSGGNAVYRPELQLDGTLSNGVIAVTSQYFGVMELRVLGRDFTADDDSVGAEATAIISDRLWTTLGRSSATIGSVMPASPMPIRIIGIAPPGFHGVRRGEDADVWIPRHLVPRVSRSSQLDGMRHGTREVSLLVFGRLKPGLTIPVAQSLLAEARRQGEGPSTAYRLVPVNSLYGTADTRTIVVGPSVELWMSGAIGAFVIVAGCASLMALVVVQYERRRQELAIRTALGCSRASLMWSLVCELGFIAAAGALGATAVAGAVLRILPALSLPGGADLSRLDLSLDWRVLAFGAIASAVTVTLGAGVPLRRATNSVLAEEVRVSSSHATPRSLRIRLAVVCVHVAAAVVALVSAGLFIRAVARGTADGPRFAVDRTLAVEVLTRSFLESAAERSAQKARDAAAIRSILEQLETIPGVTAASMGQPPIAFDPFIEARPWPFLVGSGVRILPEYWFTEVGPKYFDAIGVRILAGRALSSSDSTSGLADRQTVVTKAMATALWPNESPLGQSFRFAKRDEHYVVVGVVEDVPMGSLRRRHRYGAFVASQPEHFALTGRPRFVIGTSDPERLTEPVRRAVLAAFPHALSIKIASGRELVKRDLGSERLGAWFLTTSGVVAFLLGIAGVFGLVGYLAESRRREFGVRLALGALPSELVARTIQAGLGPVLVGTVIGLATSYGMARATGIFSLAIDPNDPAVYFVPMVLVVTAATLSGLVAAWRIRRVNPVEVLRAE